MRDMEDFIKVPVVFVLKLLGIYAYFSLRRSGLLKDTGWFKSFKAMEPIDKDGNPIPWMTYSAMSFLEKRINGNMSVFEYGCGNSTLWWARRVKKVVSCEHDRTWYEKIKELIPVNVALYHIDLEYGGAYSKKVSEYSETFDIIVIDGRDRINCGRNSLTAIKKNGVIIWDDSERDDYAEGYDHLLNHGYKRIDFEGIAPVRVDKKCTAIFYKTENCLGI
jgi:hypothetical protein